MINCAQEFLRCEGNMDHFHFIVNPISGSGKGQRTFEAVSSRLSVRSIPFTYAMSERPGHAAELAKAAVERGEKCIVAVGGDGTLREIAMALVDTDCVLGILPAGSGNDLCKTLGIPTTPEEGMDLLLGGEVRAMDACLANETLFFNVAGMGFDVEVLQRTDVYKEKLRLNGMLPYVMGIVSALAHRPGMKLTYTADGETHFMESVIFSAGNGRYIGGGMKALPHANAFDGKFDVSAVRRPLFFRFLSLLPKFIKGTHLSAPEVHYFRAEEITVESSGEYIIELDGELVEKTPVHFRMLPGALKVIAPEPKEE